MKIALSTSVIQRGKSGVGQYVFGLVRALLPHAARHEFTLFCLEEDLPLFDFAAGAMQRVPVAERWRPPTRNIAWHQGIFPSLLRDGGFEVAHVPSYRRMLWPKPCGLVATIHDLAPFRLADKYDPLRMFYGRVVARRLAERQDEIIAVSRLTANDLGEFFRLPADHLTVIPNGLDHARFFPGDREAARARLCAPRQIHGPCFLYLARLEHPAKNHLRLIEAFERFKLTRAGMPWKLVFGGSDWHGAGEIHARIRASDRRGDIHSLGFVAPADLADWYRAADVFVYPSLYEGFGLPPLEAMACGTPVLCSPRGALAEVVGDAGEFVDPENVEHLAAALAHLAYDAGRRNELRERGLRRARDFDWERTAAATLAVYGRAAAACTRNEKKLIHLGA